MKFVQENKSTSQLSHPDFLKDLYNMIVETGKFNLTVIFTNLK
jgi:hypothetical protein